MSADDPNAWKRGVVITEEKLIEAFKDLSRFRMPDEALRRATMDWLRNKKGLKEIEWIEAAQDRINKLFRIKL